MRQHQIYRTNGKNITHYNECKVICGFPGVGKTETVRRYFDTSKICDSDSSKFHFRNEKVENRLGELIEKKVLIPEWPDNYIDHIKKMIDDGNFVFVSTHDEIINALHSHDIPFCVVLPSISLYEKYMHNYSERGNDNNFIKLLSNNWHKWINNMYEKQLKYCFDIIELEEDEYLSDFCKSVINK